MKGQLNWLAGGTLLGVAFLLAVAFSKPIGVSTEFVVFSAMIGDVFNDSLVQEVVSGSGTYQSSNAYLNASGGKLAQMAADPLNYGYRFLIGMMLGVFLSSRLGGPRASGDDRFSPAVFRRRFGLSHGTRYAVVFVAGVLVLFGARLAGGCTSGHMMSGMMQTSISGYVFAIGLFLTAIPLAVMVYGRDASRQAGGH